MCNPACINFAAANFRLDEIQGRSVIEVGSFNVNGSVRSVVENLKPKEYIGVDLRMGPGVDQICDATDILKYFGAHSFDVLISTELLEHARHWQRVVSNFKNVLRPGGLILLTTRSYGFGYHCFPYDFWRYELSDMEYIFSDFIIERLEPDPLEAGVFLKARKPAAFSEKDLRNYPLYSIIKDNRVSRLTKLDVYLFRFRLALAAKHNVEIDSR